MCVKESGVCIYKGQRTTCGSGVFFPPCGSQGIKLRSSGLAAGILAHWIFSVAHCLHLNSDIPFSWTLLTFYYTDLNFKLGEPRNDSCNLYRCFTQMRAGRSFSVFCAALVSTLCDFLGCPCVAEQSDSVSNTTKASITKLRTGSVQLPPVTWSCRQFEGRGLVWKQAVQLDHRIS